MKLFCIDHKHNAVVNELDLGEITSDQEDLLHVAVDWINERQSRYNHYAVGNTATVVWDDGEAIEVSVE